MLSCRLSQSHPCIRVLFSGLAAAVHPIFVPHRHLTRSPTTCGRAGALGIPNEHSRRTRWTSIRLSGPAAAGRRRGGRARSLAGGCRHEYTRTHGGRQWTDGRTRTYIIQAGTRGRAQRHFTGPAGRRSTGSEPGALPASCRRPLPYAGCRALTHSHTREAAAAAAACAFLYRLPCHDSPTDLHGPCGCSSRVLAKSWRVGS